MKYTYIAVEFDNPHVLMLGTSAYIEYRVVETCR